MLLRDLVFFLQNYKGIAPVSSIFKSFVPCVFYFSLEAFSTIPVILKHIDNVTWCFVLSYCAEHSGLFKSKR